MPYLIESKNQIEAIIFDLNCIENIDHFSAQLLAIYNQLEGIPQLYRSENIANQNPLKKMRS